jgi:hypothetical protein
MSLVEFVPPKSGFMIRSIPRFIIKKNGKFTFSTGLVREYKQIQKAEYVRLFFDKDENAIAIKFLKTKEQENDIKINRNSGGTYIYSRSFLNIFNIEIEDRIEPNYAYDEAKNMFFIYLTGKKKAENKEYSFKKKTEEKKKYNFKKKG